MSRPGEAIYDGTVVHTRLRPRVHTLRYRVFTVLLDCARLDALDRRLRLFSHNRFNLVSFHDRDHGEGTPLGTYLAGLAERAAGGEAVRRFLMLTYPRVLGYAFNPLTVFLGLDDDDGVRLVIYEVNNTFGERKSYVLPAEPDENGLIRQSCRKRLYVSPFNSVDGTYSFHISPVGDDFTVGVALRGPDGPLLKAYFRGRRKELTDGELLRALGRTGWMTAKVTAGIHYEAAKLWLKGLKPVTRPAGPDTPVSFIDTPREPF